MKVNFKRVLAFLLVMCMLFAEFPLSAYAAPSSGNSDAQNSVSSPAQQSNSGVKLVYDYAALHGTYTDVKSITDFSQTNGFWHFVSDDGRAGSGRNVQIRKDFLTPGIQVLSYGNNKSWVAVKIYVPVDGTYAITQKYFRPAANYANVGVYLFSDDFMESVAEGTSIVTAINGQLNNSSLLGQYDICAAEANKELTADFGTKTLSKGEYYVVYRADGKNPNSANYQTYFGPLTLDGGDSAAIMKFDASVDKNTIRQADTLKINTSYVLSDPSVTAAPTITYSSSNPDAATVSNTGVITGVGGGDTEITVKAELGGTVVEKKITIRVRALNLSGTYLKIDIKKIASLKHNETVRGVSFEDTDGFWEFYADDSGLADSRFKFHTWWGFQAMGVNDGKWIALKVNIPTAGDYVMTQHYAKTGGDGGIADIYIIPGNTTKDNVSGLLIDDNKVGTVDFYGDESGQKNFQSELGAVSFETAGEYLVVYKGAGKNASSRSTYLYVGNIEFNGGDGAAIMKFDATVDKTTIRQTDKLQISNSYVLSNPNSTAVPAITYHSSNPAVATVSETGLITGFSEGDTVITVRAELDGSKAEKKISIHVDPLKMSGTYLKIRVQNAGGHDTAVRPTTFEKTKGFWEFYADNTGLADSRFKFHTWWGFQAMGVNDGKWIALKVKIPTAGDYKMTQHYVKPYGDGGKADVYVIPGNTAEGDVAGLLTKENKVGAVDFYGNESPQTIFQAELGAVKFDKAGEYLVVYKGAGKNPSSRSTYLYVGDIEFNGGANLAIMDHSFSIDRVSVKVGSKANFETSVLLSDHSTEAVTYTYTSLTPDIATVDKNGVITAKAKGTAKIKIKATAGANSVEETHTLQVEPLKLSGASVKIDYKRWQSHTDQVRKISYAETKGFWEYYADTSGQSDDRVTIHSYYGIQVWGLPKNKWFAVKVKIPAAGDYNMTQHYRPQERNGGTADVHILPGDTDADDIAAALNKFNKVGALDFYGTDSWSTAKDKTADFGAVTFDTAGEYLIVYKGTGQNASSLGTYAYIGEVELDGGKNLAAMDVTGKIDALVLKPGKKTTIETTGYLSNGANTGATFSFKSLTPSVATVSSKGVITAKSAGMAIIEITAMGTGNTKAVTTKLYVPVGNYKLSDTKVIYDYDRFLTDGASVKDVKKADTHNFWYYYASSTDAEITVDSDYGMKTTAMGTGDWIAIKINVPVKGDYVLNQYYRQQNGDGGKAAIYVLPGSTGKNAIGSKLTSSNKVGSFDCYGEPAEKVAKDKMVKAGVVNFSKAGEYLLVYKFDGKNTASSGTNLYIGNAEFIGGDKLEILDMTATTDHTTIKNYAATKIVATVYLSDGSTSTTKCAFKSSNSAVATVNEKGVVIGTKPGTTTITVTGGSFKKTFKITVEKFNGSGYNVSFDYDKYHTYLDPLRVITMEDTKEFWEYYADTSSIADDRAIIHSWWGIQLPGLGGGSWLALKVNIPEKGAYAFRQDVYLTGGNGGQYSVHLLPASQVPDRTDKAAISAAITDENKIGVIDCQGYTGSETQYVGTADIPEGGEYIIVYKGISGGGYLYLGKTELYGGAKTSIMKLEAEVAKTTMKKGDSVNIQAKTYLSDGTTPDVIYQYKSLNENAIVNRRGMITALKVGTAKVKVTAVTENDSESVTVQLAIKKVALANVSYTYPFLQGLSHGQEVRDIKYTHTNGTWEYYADGDTNRTRPLKIHSSFGVWFQNASWDHFFAAKIKVPTAGDYMFNQTYALYEAGCWLDIYILPGNTPKDKILETIKTVDKINTINTFKLIYSYEVVSENLGIVNFPKAGEYVVVYKPSKKAEGSRGAPNIDIGDIYLDGINCLKTVTPKDDEVTLNYGKTYQSKYTLRKLDGSIVDPKDCTMTYRSSDPEIASVDENGKVTALSHGTVTIEIVAYDGVESHTGSYVVNCIDNTGVKKAVLDMSTDMYVRETALVRLVAIMNSGNRIVMDVNTVDISVSDSKLMSIESGTVTALKEGKLTLKASTIFLGDKVSASLSVKITMHKGKDESTYFTEEMRNNAQANIARYDWAQRQRDTSVKGARLYLRSVEEYVAAIPYEGIPRSRQIGYNIGGSYRHCRYCGADVMELYGASGVGGWDVDPVQHPWKVQCKDCLRWFPSNDFESFYKLGLDENGVFDYYKAWDENDKLIAKGHKGYLVNELYPEMGEGWGVDDGYGARVYKDGGPMRRLKIGKDESGKPLKAIYAEELDLDKSACYIPLCLWETWGTIRGVVLSFANAYVYTGDITYARAGMKILDRIADVMPTYNMNANYYNYDFLTTCGGTGYGYFIGRIDDTIYVSAWAEAADAFWPALNDPATIKYLNKKAIEQGLENDKSSSQKIWKNWRDRILLETWQGAKDGRLAGNFGQMQRSISAAALVLDEQPESEAMIQWLMASNIGAGSRNAVAGNMYNQLYSVFDRDGIGNEGSPNYNFFWMNMLYQCANDLAMYNSEDPFYNLYLNPKFALGMVAADAMTLSDSHTAEFGDSGQTAGLAFVTNANRNISAWKNLKDTPLAKRLANYIYIVSGGKITGNYGIFHEDPETYVNDIMQYVDKHAEKESQLLAGHGYGVLRDGITGDKESLRMAWLYYGQSWGHGHQGGTLNLGIEAFGINMAPDLGYPANTIGDDTNGQWLRTPYAHNTVCVDGTQGFDLYEAEDTYLYDDSDYVKVIGVDSDSYYRQCDIFKRTVVMVKVDGDNSYFVDFFRVSGGAEHTYSFHSQSHGAMPVEGLNVEFQMDEKGNMVGTYAGPDVKKGERGDFNTGYQYMTKVRKDSNPESNKFTVDFGITDYRGALSNGAGLHLKMTQINNFVPDEVAIVGGHVPVKKDNLPITDQTDTLDHVLTQRYAKKGQKLDSLFTTIFEPYRNDAYISNIEELDVKVVSGKPGEKDMARAVKVTHKSGRVDYVFYASNNAVTYRVADTFNIRGYVGVYSIDGNKGTEVYRYVTGGDIIVEQLKQPDAYTGKIIDFSKDVTLDNNYIDITLDGKYASELIGKVIRVENDGKESAIYEISNAVPIEGGTRVYTGFISLIRALRDPKDLEAGYLYNVAKGQRATILNSYVHSDLSKYAKLMFLDVKGARLSPTFDPDEIEYRCFVGENVKSLGFKAIAADPDAKVQIEKGKERYLSGDVEEIGIAPGQNLIEVTVTAEDGMSTKTYYITITRAQHMCYGGTAYCNEKAICVSCERHYGEIDVNSHKDVELWNAVVPTEEADGYSGDYYCVVCHLMATKGHVLAYEAPVNIVLILCIAAGVLLAGGAAATLIVISKKKGKPTEPNPEEDNAPEAEEPTDE